MAEPGHTYVVSVVNLPEPKSGDYRIRKQITFPGEFSSHLVHHSVHGGIYLFIYLFIKSFSFCPMLFLMRNGWHIVVHNKL